MIASQQNFGKLKQGQQVNIALNSYQRNEFGVLQGTIINIPQVPYKDTSFLIKVNSTMACKQIIKRPFILVIV